MTVPAEVPVKLPDLRAVPLAALPSLSAAGLDAIVQRFLPATERSVQTAVPAGNFSSAL